VCRLPEIGDTSRAGCGSDDFSAGLKDGGSGTGSVHAGGLALGLCAIERTVSTDRDLLDIDRAAHVNPSTTTYACFQYFARYASYDNFDAAVGGHFNNVGLDLLYGHLTATFNF